MSQKIFFWHLPAEIRRTILEPLGEASLQQSEQKAKEAMLGIGNSDTEAEREPDGTWRLAFIPTVPSSKLAKVSVIKDFILGTSLTRSMDPAAVDPLLNAFPNVLGFKWMHWPRAGPAPSLDSDHRLATSMPGWPPSLTNITMSYQFIMDDDARSGVGLRPQQRRQAGLGTRGAATPQLRDNVLYNVYRQSRVLPYPQRYGEARYPKLHPERMEGPSFTSFGGLGAWI
ncbi:hypothetical protein B0T25DRAFT_594758 [Lasiosphaeria hispida]|uniref:Uncharacterized protein n=1 Tax=Lasiosphaeria hispida TaxID=260671 RepID=A0AAJ0MJ65_9PEZI|nr:hypothetical protein B0T25DRAFT_594758 [Lasiosphaeria hispida]